MPTVSSYSVVGREQRNTTPPASWLRKRDALVAAHGARR